MSVHELVVGGDQWGRRWLWWGVDWSRYGGDAAASSTVRGEDDIVCAQLPVDAGVDELYVE